MVHLKPGQPVSPDGAENLSEVAGRWEKMCGHLAKVARFDFSPK
jgi:hypothetical protein